MRIILSYPAVTAISLLLSISTPDFACGANLYQVPAQNISLSERVSDELSKSDIFAPAIKYKIHSRQNELLVSTYRDPRANLTDLKIDALLITHAGMKVTDNSKLFPKLNRVSVYFFDRDDNSKFWLAEVNPTLIDLLRSNHTNKDEALEKVSLCRLTLNNPLDHYSGSSYQEMTESFPLSPGFLEPERRILLARIMRLKEKGRDVSSLERLFLQMDDSIRSNGGDSGIKPLYVYTLQMLEAKEKNRLSALNNEQIQK